MRKLTYFPLILLIGFASACTSSKKFDFTSAYKFRTIRRAQEHRHDQQPPINVLEATSEATTSRKFEPASALSEAENNLLEKTGLKAEEETITREELTARVNSLTKKEKKILRRKMIKELKAEMKAINSMEKNEFHSVSETSDLDISGYTLTGVLVGGLGVIVLVLGAIFGVGILTFAGAALVIMGVVFILIDII